METGEWVLADRAFVDVVPHFHPYQHDPDVQGSVKLGKWASLEDHIIRNSERRLEPISLKFISVSQEDPSLSTSVTMAAIVLVPNAQ